MDWFAKLKLNTKLNLILFTLLICLFIITAYLTYRDQQNLVQNLALEHSRGVAKQVIATTDYMSDVVRDEPETNYGLVPQVVSTQIAKRISEGNRYAVRQISLNYRNPENKPDDFEIEQLKSFSGPPSKESYQVLNESGDKVFRYMRSMIAEKSCLECHGSYESAPTFIQERYPPEHSSYNYEVGQVLGAVSVSWPMSDLYNEIGTNLRLELTYRIGILALVFIVMGMLTRRFIVEPISTASSTIHRVAMTGDLSERILVKGSSDEIGRLINGFNEMMAELERTTLLRQESESRYQSLIEATPAAILTFLENGKIVISNKMAENLLGVSGNKLLGESFFDFLEDGGSLSFRIANSLREKKWNDIGFVTEHKLRKTNDEIVEVSATIVLASNLDNVPIFTAIITETWT
jgi:PAS domain S-box-containing protein